MIIDYTRLINKEHPLPAAYVPHGLVDLGLPFTCPPSDPRRLLEKKAAHAAMELITRASQEGISLYCISGYRSYARQKELYRHTAYVAAPGTSEHQTGLAVDLSTPICNNEVYKLIVYSNLSIMKIPLIARKNKFYFINIGNYKRKDHLVTVLLMDKYYPNIKIEGGQMILWQDIQSQ